MDDLEPIDLRALRETLARHGGCSRPSQPRIPPGEPLSAARVQPVNVTFDRRELQEILNLYGRKVAAGEWRDYAIDFSPSLAVFSIFRRTSELPLYRIEKNPKQARRQGLYSVVASTGLILKRGPDLTKVLAVLEKKLRLV